MKRKIIRTATVPISLDILLKGQLQFLNETYEVIAVSGENENLKNILIKMARWYNFNVKFEQKALEQIKFTGIVLKDEPIDRFLDVISKSSNVKYKITKVNQTYEVTVSK